MPEMTNAQVALMAAAQSSGEKLVYGSDVTKKADLFLAWLRKNS